MWDAIVEINLLKGGTHVELVFKRGAKRIVEINRIVKEKEEEELMETWAEGFLFPVKVDGKRAFVYACEWDAVKNGELFRAVVNAASINDLKVPDE